MSKSSRPRWFNDQELSATRLLVDSIISGARLHKGTTKTQLINELHGSYTGNEVDETFRLPENVITYIEKNKYGHSRRMTQPVRWKVAQIALKEGWLKSYACPPGVDVNLWERAIAMGAAESQYLKLKNSKKSEPWRLLEDMPHIEQDKQAIKDFERKRANAKAQIDKTLAAIREVTQWLEQYTDPTSADYLLNHAPDSTFFEDRQIEYVDDWLDDLLDGLVTFANDGAMLTEILDSIHFAETTVGLPAESLKIKQAAQKFLDAYDLDNREFLGEEGPLPALSSEPDVEQFVANRRAEEDATEHAREFELMAWHAVRDSHHAAPSLPSRLVVTQLEHLMGGWEQGWPRRYDELRKEPPLPEELARRNFDRQLLVSLKSAYKSNDDAADRWKQIWAEEFTLASCHSIAIEDQRSGTKTTEEKY